MDHIEIQETGARPGFSSLIENLPPDFELRDPDPGCSVPRLLEDVVGTYRHVGNSPAFWRTCARQWNAMPSTLRDRILPPPMRHDQKNGILPTADPVSVSLRPDGKESELQLWPELGIHALLRCVTPRR